MDPLSCSRFSTRTLLMRLEPIRLSPNREFNVGSFLACGYLLGQDPGFSDATCKPGVGFRRAYIAAWVVVKQDYYSPSIYHTFGSAAICMICLTNSEASGAMNSERRSSLRLVKSSKRHGRTISSLIPKAEKSTGEALVR
jgi:hypothetical protein